MAVPLMAGLLPLASAAVFFIRALGRLATSSKAAFRVFRRLHVDQPSGAPAWAAPDHLFQALVLPAAAFPGDLLVDVTAAETLTIGQCGAKHDYASALSRLWASRRPCLLVAVPRNVSRRGGPRVPLDASLRRGGLLRRHCISMLIVSDAVPPAPRPKLHGLGARRRFSVRAAAAFGLANAFAVFGLNKRRWLRCRTARRVVGRPALPRSSSSPLWLAKGITLRDQVLGDRWTGRQRCSEAG